MKGFPPITFLAFFIILSSFIASSANGSDIVISDEDDAIKDEDLKEIELNGVNVRCTPAQWAQIARILRPGGLTAQYPQYPQQTYPYPTGGVSQQYPLQGGVDGGGVVDVPFPVYYPVPADQYQPVPGGQFPIPEGTYPVPGGQFPANGQSPSGFGARSNAAATARPSMPSPPTRPTRPTRAPRMG